MFSFTTCSEEELYDTMPEGEYPFYVQSAQNAYSRSGNPMMKLTLKIYDHNNRERIITDYLLDAMRFKIKHFCDATGLQEKWEAGTFNTDDCINKSGKCIIKIDIDETGKYQPKNSVRDYVKLPKGETAKPVEPPVGSDLNGDIPF